jgi:SH3-like domain-containing protein
MIRWMFLIVALATTTSASALDFKSLNDNAIVYDGGSTKATPQFILLKGTPVEIILTVDKWAKIREQSGGMGWVEQTLVGDTRQVIVTATLTQIRAQPNENAPVVFSAEKNVLLEVQEKPTGAWLKVKHQDGQSGYISIKSIWGI